MLSGISFINLFKTPLLSGPIRGGEIVRHMIYPKGILGFEGGLRRTTVKPEN